MMPLQHKTIASKWATMSLVAQLGNVGSEVGRATNRERQNNIEQRDKALERALELLDLTIADVRWQARLKELCRSRGLLGDAFWGTREYGATPEQMDKYFSHFAFAARNDR